MSRLIICFVGIAFGQICFAQTTTTVHSVVNVNSSTSIRDTTQPPSGATINKPALKQAPANVNINYLPLFGGYEKTMADQINDELFKSECDSEFGSRKQAADFFIKMGWQYLGEGSKSLAIHRFNLAYLLYPTLLDIYWGLGVVEFQKNKYKEALQLMTQGLKYCDNTNYTFWTDLATVYIQLAMGRPDSKAELLEAQELLQKAILYQPNYAQAYVQLSLLNILENKYTEAWENFHKAYVLKPIEVNTDLLKNLLKHQPDPKGIFK